MEFSLAQVEAALDARRPGGRERSEPENLRVRGWSTDSRTIRERDLFFALKGEHYDGHAFAKSALELGAVAAVVSEHVDSTDGRLLVVPDTLAALQSLARWARRRWGRQVVAITGSAGKTTTKDVIAHLLHVRFRVGKSAGNLNNHIGLPLSILRIPDEAEVAVFELAMNHAGEIRKLAEIAEPETGVVTNVGFAHVEAFGSIEGIAAEKRALIEALPATGVAVLNADDERVAGFRRVHNGRVVTYGISSEADVRATKVEVSADGASFTVRGVRFYTALAGRHNVLNILAGLAVADTLGIELRELVERVRELTQSEMRGERRNWRGAMILDDCYNSNPEAARSMIDVLRREDAKRRIAVLGEMLELGGLSESLHREVGRYAANQGVDVLIGVRGESRSMVEEARRAGLANGAAFFFEEPEAAGLFLRDFVCEGDAILFKGSRGTHVERALARMEA